MKKIYILLIFYLFCLTSAQNPDYKKSIDSLMNYYKENNAFSGNILIQKKGETIYNGEFNKFRSDSDLYRIGSITKIFTAIIVFQLIEEGKLSLNTTLNKYFPIIKNADKITIANMLNHTSGIYDYLQWEGYYTNKSKNYTHEDLLKLITQGKPESKPGSISSYSNSNYLLLGYIIEEITKKSFTENIKIRITDKLGLSHTFVEPAENYNIVRNNSYNYNGEDWIKEAETNPTFTLSAGAIVSSPEDLAKLMYHLFQENLISKSSLEQMEKTNTKTWIGYGLFKAPFNKRVGYGHSGRVDEFQSFVGYFPEEDLAFVFLSNGTNVKINEIVLGVVSKYYGTKYTYPDFTTYKSESAPSTEIYIGLYKAQLAGLITLGKFQITKAGKDHLFVSMNEAGSIGEKALLERKSENSFYARKYNSEFNFLLDQKGKVTGIKMKQGNQTIKCVKID